MEPAQQAAEQTAAGSRRWGRLVVAIWFVLCFVVLGVVVVGSQAKRWWWSPPPVLHVGSVIVPVELEPLPVQHDTMDGDCYLARIRTEGRIWQQMHNVGLPQVRTSGRLVVNEVRGDGAMASFEPADGGPSIRFFANTGGGGKYIGFSDPCGY